MDIRLAGTDDAGAISELVSVLTSEFISGEFSDKGRQHLLGSMTPQAIKGFIEDGYRYHLGEISGTLVGVVGLKGNKHLYHMFVAKKFHRQGIAKKLWEHAMQECINRGNSGEFTVNSSAFAQPVYKKLGFTTLSGPKKHEDVMFYPMKLILRSS